MLDPPYDTACKNKYYGPHSCVDTREIKGVLEHTKGKFLLADDIRQKDILCKGTKFKCSVLDTTYGNTTVKTLVVKNY